MTLYIIIGTCLAAVLLFVLIQRSRLSKSNFADPVDPIAEVEVYLAYGRKKQAIALLQKAKRIYPDRDDIAKKLDEINQ